MTNTKELRAVIAETGIKYNFIAEKLGISRYTLQLKIDDSREFKPSEIEELCKILGITSLKERNKLFFKK